MRPLRSNGAMEAMIFFFFFLMNVNFNEVMRPQINQLIKCIHSFNFP